MLSMEVRTRYSVGTGGAAYPGYWRRTSATAHDRWFGSLRQVTAQKGMPLPSGNSHGRQARAQAGWCVRFVPVAGETEVVRVSGWSSTGRSSCMSTACGVLGVACRYVKQGAISLMRHTLEKAV